MRDLSRIIQSGLRLIVLEAALVLCQTAHALVTFSATPSTVNDQYAGVITLQIQGLTNGETVLIEKYLDANSSGMVDGGDLLVQSFSLTDGQASVIAGVTNLNVPYDTDSTTGTITARMNFQSSSLEQRLVAHYVYELSSPTGHFAPLTNSLTVTNAPYAQTVSGTVMDAGTSNPVPNAVVILSLDYYGGNPAAGTVADSAGHFNIGAAPGSYLVWAFKSNYVFQANSSDGPGSYIQLDPETSIGTDVSLLAATNTISGRAVDASNTNRGLAGVAIPLIQYGSYGRPLTICFSDAQGNFTVPVASTGYANWSIGDCSYFGQSVEIHGLVDMPSYVGIGGIGGSQSTNLTISFPPVTAMVYGSIKDAQNRPLAGVRVSGGYCEGTDVFKFTSVATDANGNYSVGSTAGLRSVQIDSDYLTAIQDYVFSMGLDFATVEDGTVVRHDFTAYLATNHISGHVFYSDGRPIQYIRVYAYATIAGADCFAWESETSGDGSYSLSVPNGAWDVGLNIDDLAYMEFKSPGEQIVTVSNSSPAVDFIVQSCSLQIIPVALPKCRVGQYYNAQLEASACDPFIWQLSRGVIPPGLYLSPNGTIFGFPTAVGSYRFWVRVLDNKSYRSLEQLLTIEVKDAPLEVITRSLPGAAAGKAYTIQLEAMGGSTPYQWSVSPGSASLPSGLEILGAGAVSGTPIAPGTFYFYVRVTDAVTNTADQLLGLTVAPAPALTGILLADPKTLGNGQFQFTFNSLPGTNYTVQYCNDLSNWLGLRTLTGAGGQMIVVDSNAADSGARFYRVKLGP